MPRLRKHRANIVWCISLVLLLLPVAQSFACRSAHSFTQSVDQDILITQSNPNSPSCHSAQSKSDNVLHEQLKTSGPMCNGDCCQNCMVSYIMNTLLLAELLYDSIYFQITVLALKPDIMSVPAIPPPIV
jgi:hypothetical protein